MRETYEIQFQPDGLRIEVEHGTLLTDAMRALGIPIQLPCAGTGKCGKCVVEIYPDAPPPGDFDRLHLSGEDLDRGFRLACQTRVDRDMRVLIGSGLRVLDGKILVDGMERTFELNPAVSKRYVELPEPTLQDQVSDMFRIKRALGAAGDDCPEFEIDLARRLPSILREAGFRVTVVMLGDRIIAVEPGDTTSRMFGIAFDIGTTTVVGTILDLSTGEELSRASRLNSQVVYGEDTISRIKHAVTDPDGVRDMQDKIRSVVNEIIEDAAGKAGIEPVELYEAVFVGNTTMSHLFLGIDPRGLSQVPFVPVIDAGVNLRAGDAGIGIHPNGNVYVLPNIAGFVGSDTVGVMLACGYLEDGPSVLAVDVGTNGELALRRDDTILVCSTAAGPALEGAALTCGMRAANGAVEHVKISPDGVGCEVIGGTSPIGLCGSGIIDVVAELLEVGIVDGYGTIVEKERLEGSVPDALLERIVTVDGQPAFVVSRGDESGPDSRDVVFTQRDVRQVQLAKGAISAGINLILKEMGMTVEELDEILLAGAFGNYIDKDSARRIGLLPQVPSGKIRFVGNAASTGAKMALLSANAREDADRIRNRAKHVELANLPGFMDELSNSMLFP